MKFRTLFLILGFLLAGCVSVEVCEEEYVSELVASFKTLKDGTVADTTVNTFSLYGIREGQIDSPLYDSVRASGFKVPLDPNHDYSSFVMQIDSLRDTLRIYYEHQIYLISYSCGFASLFTLDRLEASTGVIQNDSIRKEIIDAENDDNEANIWLYL